MHLFTEIWTGAADQVGDTLRQNKQGADDLEMQTRNKFSRMTSVSFGSSLPASLGC